MTIGRDPSRVPKLVGFVGLVLLLGVVVGIGRLVREDSRLRLAITSWPGYEYFYLAEQKHLARSFGLELEVQQYNSLEDQRAAYVRGDVEVIATTIPESIAICQEAPSRCPELILVLDQSDGADVLVSLRDITGVGALAGRKVGFERTVLAEYLLLRALETEGLRLPQVQQLNDGPSGLVAALQANRVAAIVTYPPHSNGLVQDPRYRVLFSSASIPGEIVDVLAVNPAYALRHPARLRALVRTWWAAHALARAEPAASVALMAQREQVSPAVFVASEQGIRYPAPGDQQRMLAPDGPLARVVARMADQMLTAERIQPDAPLPKPSRAFLVGP